MAELRYTIKTAGDYLGMHVYEVQRRARHLQISMKNGLTARDVARIAALDYPRTIGKSRATMEDLKKEMEALQHE